VKRGTALAVLFACAAVAACGGPSPARKKEASSRMQMGVSYLEQRNLPAAMKELLTASKLDPENPEIDVVLGLAYQNRGDLEAAERYFRDAIRKKSDYADAHNDLGIVLSLQGRGDEAIREFEIAAADVLYTTPEWAYFNMGEEYRRRKELAKAEAMYRKAIVLNDRYVMPYRRIALLQGEKGRWEEAVRTLEACVAVAPSHDAAWLDLGRAYAAAGRKGDARTAYRKVLSGTADNVLRGQADELVKALDREGE
jgi:type IV pilus biogenesis/stability protein PilW